MDHAWLFFPSILLFVLFCFIETESLCVLNLVFLRLIHVGYYILFNGQIIFFYIDIPHFEYLLIGDQHLSSFYFLTILKMILWNSCTSFHVEACYHTLWIGPSPGFVLIWSVSFFSCCNDKKQRKKKKAFALSHNSKMLEVTSSSRGVLGSRSLKILVTLIL